MSTDDSYKSLLTVFKAKIQARHEKSAAKVSKVAAIKSLYDSRFLVTSSPAPKSMSISKLDDSTHKPKP